jgi:hypothetical protein
MCLTTIRKQKTFQCRLELNSIVLVEDSVSIDKYKIESEFIQLSKEPFITVRVMFNKLR